jgi:hypothetical protein
LDFVTIWGLGVMLNTAAFISILTEMDGHKLIHVVIGMLFTLIGTYILCTHHLFTSVHTMLITLLGYVFFIHGSLMLVLPDVIISIRKTVIKRIPVHVVGFIIFAIGIVVAYHGFF